MMTMDKSIGQNGLKSSIVLYALFQFEFYLFQMACSNIRYGAGCTKEVGLVS